MQLKLMLMTSYTTAPQSLEFELSPKMSHLFTSRSKELMLMTSYNFAPQSFELGVLPKSSYTIASWSKLLDLLLITSYTFAPQSTKLLDFVLNLEFLNLGVIVNLLWLHS